MVFKSNKVSASETPLEPKTDDDDDGKKWKGMMNNSFEVISPSSYLDMNRKQRIIFVIILILKIIGILGLLYIFVCSLDVMSSAFRLVGGKEIFDDKKINKFNFFSFMIR